MIEKNESVVRSFFWVCNCCWSLSPFSLFGKSQDVILLKVFFECKIIDCGLDPWSCGYWRRVAFKRSWVQIQAVDTRWIIFTLYCSKNCNVCLLKTESKRKRGREWTMYKIIDCTTTPWKLPIVIWIGINHVDPIL